MPLTLGKARPRQRLLSGSMLLWPHYLLKRYGQWRDFATRYESASSDSLTTFLPGYNLKPNTLNICVNFLSSCASSIGRRCGWSGAVASLLLLLTWTNPHAMLALPSLRLGRRGVRTVRVLVCLCVEVRLWALRPMGLVGILPLRFHRNSGPRSSLVNVRLMGLCDGSVHCAVPFHSAFWPAWKPPVVCVPAAFPFFTMQNYSMLSASATKNLSRKGTFRSMQQECTMLKHFLQL